MEIYGNLLKSIENYGKLWKSIEIYGNLWNTMENDQKIPSGVVQNASGFS